MEIKDLPIPLSRHDKYKYAIITESINNLPNPESVSDLYLKALIDGDIDNLPVPSKNASRLEIYMYNTIMATLEDIPKPLSTLDKYWYAICTGLKTDMPNPENPSDYYDYYLAEHVALREWLTYDGTYIRSDISRSGQCRNVKIQGRTYRNITTLEDQVNVNVTFWYNEVTLIPDASKFEITNGDILTIAFDHHYVEGNKELYTDTELVYYGDVGVYSPVKYNHELKEGRNIFTSKVPTVAQIGKLCKVTLRGCRRLTTPVAGEYIKFTQTNYICLLGDYSKDAIPNTINGIESSGEKENNINISAFNKNLFDINNCNNILPFAFVNHDHEVIGDTLKVVNNRNFYYGNCNKVKVKPNTIYTFSANATFEGVEDGKKPMYYGQIWMPPYQAYNNLTLIRSVGNRIETVFTVPEGIEEIMIEISQTNCTTMYLSNIQLEANNHATEYVKHISQNEILDELILRDVKCVCDEYDCDTGILTKKTDILTLNGNESSWFVYGVASKDGYSSFAMPFDKCNPYEAYCDTFNVGRYVTSLEEQLVLYPNEHLYITMKSDKLSENSVDGFKQWLNENPITIYYQLKKPIEEKIKTIDIKTHYGTTEITTNNKIRANIIADIPIKQ